MPELLQSLWRVYMVACADGSLYTGITTDLARRLAEHNSVRGGARYTRPRRPVRLVYSERAASRSAAAKREYRIKRLPPAGKRALIAVAGSPKELPDNHNQEDEP